MPFDRDYYKRFYYDPRTAVTTRREMHGRAHLIAAFAEHTGLPVRRILDAGCGTGMLRVPLLRRLPRAHYTGLETSEYLCERYGWEHGQVDQYRSASPFDLVICYDVLQYLNAAAASRAIDNFARLCRGILYFSALTKLDWEYNCDTKLAYR
jgi:2-polyprenyl-3-methyl-5-hydroxy-6-metoxy-1,4-benzoquinol methylase